MANLSGYLKQQGRRTVFYQVNDQGRYDVAGDKLKAVGNDEPIRSKTRSKNKLSAKGCGWSKKIRKSQIRRKIISNHNSTFKLTVALKHNGFENFIWRIA